MKKELANKIKLDEVTHKVFKEYCKDNGYNMGGLLGKMIREKLNIKK